MALLRLARQLGLIETIYVDGGAANSQNNLSSSSPSLSSSPSSSSSSSSSTATTRTTAASRFSSKLSSSCSRRRMQITVQPFEYIIVIDFESTCWENEAPPKWRESEIIEFPAILINLKTGKIESEFHKYIMPIESPTLSSFCIQLTGIKQDILDYNGIPLQTAIMMFQEWLRKQIKIYTLLLPKMSKTNLIGNCAFVTWSDINFGVNLIKECQRKNIKIPQYFNQWCNLKQIYKELYNYCPLNLNDALNHLNIKYDGRQHSGLDNSKNIGKLAYKMINDGAKLCITKDLTPFQINNYNHNNYGI